MASRAFDRFRFSFFEDPDSARGGLDAAALAELTGDERTSAEDMLINYLPDSRGIIGLGLLRSGRAERQLVQLFEAEQARRQASELAPGDWWPYSLIALGKSLWKIRPDPRWLAPVIDVLASADNAIERQTAAQALADVQDANVVGALKEALEDPESLVRYHAARGLLGIHGLPLPDFNQSEHMIFRVMSKDAARRNGGRQDVLAAIVGSAIRPE